MDEQRFWALIDATRKELTPELSNQPEILRAKLEALPAEEILAFDRIFAQLLIDAYRWDLWAAAYIIEGGCGDDGFMDFRAGLIGLGEQVYRDAIRDPSTLVRQPTRGIDFSQEPMLYAASQAYETVTGKEIPNHVISASGGARG
jgi:hypothetical protein